MKIVLDTNVLVSGLLNSNGKPAEALNLALSGAAQICYNDSIVREYAEVLARSRFKFDPARVAEVLSKLTIDGIHVDASAYAQLNLPDPDDAMFLAVALAGQADHLVTGNLVHFPAEKRRDCSVITPGEFLNLWNSKRNSTE